MSGRPLVYCATKTYSVYWVRARFFVTRIQTHARHQHTSLKLGSSRQNSSNPLCREGGDLSLLQSCPRTAPADAHAPTRTPGRR